MKELHLQEYEKDLTHLTFLRAIASSIFVVLLFVLVPLFAFEASPDFMNFFIPSDYLQSLTPSTKAIAAILCAVILFPWMVALARVWRRTIAVYSLAIGALLAVAQAMIVVVVFQESTFATSRQIIFSVTRLSFALLGAAISLAFAWYIVNDGWLKGNKRERRVVGTGSESRNVGEIIQAAFGIEPECSLLPRWWQRLAARFLFLLASIGRGLQIFLLILLLIPFRIKGAEILIPEGIDLTTQQIGELDAPFWDIIARAVNIGFYRALLILPVIAVRSAARRIARVSVDTLLEEDARPPVLFLRSFFDDQVRLDWGRRGRLRDWIAFGEPSPSLDHLVLYGTMPLGPAVAIGKPNAAVPFGIARTYVSDDHWQDEIAHLAKAATAIVIVADDTSGVKWEFGYVDNHCAAKTLYLIPPRFASPDDAVELLNGHLLKPSTTPSEQTSVPDRELAYSCIGWYLNKDDEPILLTSDNATATAYIVALRLYVLSRIGQVATAASEPQFKERHKAEKPSKSEVISVYRTSRGIVVLLEDARVLAPVSDEYRIFVTAAEYRQLFNDTEPWTEIKDSEELRGLLQAHSDLFKPTT